MAQVERWTGREARALREALRMSVRAFAAHLGVNTSAVSNWEKRGPQARLRYQTQEMLDTDLRLASDEARARFHGAVEHQAAVAEVTKTSAADRGGAADLVTVAQIREQLWTLDVAYDREPSSALLGDAGRWHGQVEYLLHQGASPRVRRELHAAHAESSTLLGQLLWDASQRRDHVAPVMYFDRAVEAAEQVGDKTAIARARLRTSYVALYGLKDPRRGRDLAMAAADASRSTSPTLTGLALLHVAEAHSMLGDGQAAEQALAAGETRLDQATSDDAARELYAPSLLPRMAGSCYLNLGAPERAATFLEQVLAGGGAASKPGAVATANLALAYSRQDKLDGAVATLHRAIDVLADNRGGGGLNVAFTVGRELNRWREDAAVREVHDRLWDLVAA
ncbi:transcriptional regulator [Cryptosporangium japonicum]|uniref:HTH cro/C1-type domain-containing protein n=1 Tax=Cryptosporangium japonicum TaxID=80872 RepID=A0ABN0UXZ2_9ACTN